jgi:hypothetical protein
MCISEELAKRKIEKGAGITVLLPLQPVSKLLYCEIAVALVCIGTVF